jgi:hypothetical protein
MGIDGPGEPASDQLEGIEELSGGYSSTLAAVGIPSGAMPKWVSSRGLQKKFSDRSNTRWQDA